MAYITAARHSGHGGLRPRRERNASGPRRGGGAKWARLHEGAQTDAPARPRRERTHRPEYESRARARRHPGCSRARHHRGRHRQRVRCHHQRVGTSGTPYDVLDATHGPTLTDANLAQGNHGKYQAVFLDLGGLPVAGTSAFSDAEWMTLASYEARFGVRRVVLYASPAADYGLQLASEVDPGKTPMITHCTAAGSAAFCGGELRRSADHRHGVGLPGNGRPTRRPCHCSSTTPATFSPPRA